MMPAVQTPPQPPPGQTPMLDLASIQALAEQVGQKWRLSSSSIPPARQENIVAEVAALRKRLEALFMEFVRGDVFSDPPPAPPEK